MMNDKKEVVRPEKTIVISCKEGAWKAVFMSRNNAPITIPDIKRVNRALGHGHRVYIREITLRLKRLKREAEEKVKAEALASSST